MRLQLVVRQKRDQPVGTHSSVRPLAGGLPVQAEVPRPDVIVGSPHAGPLACGAARPFPYVTLQEGNTVEPVTKDQVLDLLTRVGAMETALLRAASQLHDIRHLLNQWAYPVRDLDDVDRGHGPATCRHLTPIGDYCPFCQETGGK